MTRRRTTALVLASLLLLVAGCSNRQAAVNRRPQVGTATASSVNGEQQITIDVDDTYRFHPDTITVHPGSVKVILVHQGTGAPHDFEVVGIPADFVPAVSGGHTQSATFIAPAPGRYEFVCTFHVAQGQTGTLVVLPN